MSGTTLFISDLHLSAARPAITELFHSFLETEARTAAALYILGDLFEYWIGDDADEEPEFAPLIAALHRLTAGGTPVFVMHGNRDFLMGARFERASGCRLLADPSRIELDGLPVLLTHGDALCTDDHEYMAFRRMVRDPQWQRQFLAKARAERDAIARNTREASRVSTAQKAPEIMDVNPAAVATLMRTYGIRDLIHGHTHRPAIHRFALDGEPARRVVLGDWYEQGSVLRCRAGGWQLAGLAVTPARRSEAARGAGR